MNTAAKKTAKRRQEAKSAARAKAPAQGSLAAKKMAAVPEIPDARLNKKNVVIAQSGGPTMVINASLVGAVEVMQSIRELYPDFKFGKILGAKHGVEGILKSDYIDLTKLRESTLAKLLTTPSSALGSCRHKPDAEDCRKIFEEFKRRNVGFFFYIGGNDSADAARIVAEEAESEGYPLVVYHIPKTIDNDLRSCDHTPGFGSAARFVASAIRGDDLDNRALGGVKIDVIMGRDAGFLTAASALARAAEDDGPHLVYLPEVPFSLDKFVKDVNKVVKRLGRCVVAVSEGIRGKDGVPIGATLGAKETDSHGNVQMSGTGALGDYLAKAVKASGVKRVRADTFGYLQRSFPGVQSEVDVDEARHCGAFAVLFAVKSARGEGVHSKGTVGIVRADETVRGKKRYGVDYVSLPIRDAAKYTRSLPKQFIAKSGVDVTQAFLDYARPIVGELPDTVTLF